MLGFGIVGEGVTADVTGTSTLVAAHTAKPLLNPVIQNCRHVVEGWIPFTILDCGGLSMKWCKDLVSSLNGKEVSYNDLILQGHYTTTRSVLYGVVCKVFSATI
jgi:sugar (pentulose or hexulose) kinase